MVPQKDVEFNSDITGTLIEMVREHPELYDVRHDNFKKSKLKTQLYNRIGIQLKQIYPEHASLFYSERLKKKFNSLKTYYKEQRKKLNKPSGSAGGFKVTWPHFEAMRFLDSVLDVVTSTSNFDTSIRDLKSEDMPDEVSERTTNDVVLPLPKRNSRKTRTSAKARGAVLYTSVDISPIMESEDITYYSRKMIQEMCVYAYQFQRHAHREKLTVSDTKKASNFYEFTRKLSGDGNEDIDIDVDSYEDEITVCEGPHKMFYGSRCLHCPGIDTVNDLEIDNNLKEYFTLTLKAISCDESELLTVSLADLERNAFIMPLLPLFIQHLCSDIALLKYTPKQLKKVLQVLQSLYLNPNMYFRNELLHKLLNFIILCAINKLPSVYSQIKENCSLRDTAAELLNVFFMKNKTNMRALYELTLQKLENVFHGKNLNLLSYYGSLASIKTLGLSTITYILPLIFANPSNNVYDTLRKSKISETGDEILVSLVDQKLFDVCKCFFNFHIKKLIMSLDSSEFKVIFSNPDDAPFAEDIDDIPLNFNVCLIILEYFSETLSLYLPSITDKSNEKVPVEKLLKMQLERNS